MAGRLVLKSVKRRGKPAGFMFNLVAPNGSTVLTSEVYETRKSAVGGAESVKKNAGNPKRFARDTGKDGRPFFVLRSGNGQTIGRSQMYRSERGMEKGIASVQRHAPEAPIVEPATV